MFSSQFHRSRRGFTLVEIMVAVAIVGILAAVAIPVYTGYLKKTKASEASVMLQKLYSAARVYYLGNNQFPATVPTAPSLGECCKNGNDRCIPQPSLWTDETWIALNFSLDDPHYFSYQYTSDTSTHFYVRAFGDLDCDGNYSTYQMMGEINKAYADGPAGTASIYKVDPLE